MEVNPIWLIAAGIVGIVIVIRFIVGQSSGRKSSPVDIWKTDAEKQSGFLKQIKEDMAKGKHVAAMAHFRECYEEMKNNLLRGGIDFIEVTNHDKLEALIKNNEYQQDKVITVCTEHIESVNNRDAEFRRKEQKQNSTQFSFLCYEIAPICQMDIKIEKFAENLPVKADIRYFTSLQTPLMSMFGSERMMEIMDRLGMKPGENLSSPMLTRSIHTAQKRVENEVLHNTLKPAQSMIEWFQLNSKVSVE